VFSNAFAYNQPNSDVFYMATEVSNYFSQIFSLEKAAKASLSMPSNAQLSFSSSLLSNKKLKQKDKKEHKTHRSNSKSTTSTKDSTQKKQNPEQQLPSKSATPKMSITTPISTPKILTIKIKLKRIFPRNL